MFTWSGVGTWVIILLFEHRRCFVKRFNRKLFYVTMHHCSALLVQIFTEPNTIKNHSSNRKWMQQTKKQCKRMNAPVQHVCVESSHQSVTIVLIKIKMNLKEYTHRKWTYSNVWQTPVPTFQEMCCSASTHPPASLHLLLPCHPLTLLSLKRKFNKCVQNIGPFLVWGLRARASVAARLTLAPPPWWKI